MRGHRKEAPRTEPRPRGSWAGDSRHWLLLGQTLFVFLLQYKAVHGAYNIRRQIGKNGVLNAWHVFMCFYIVFPFHKHGITVLGNLPFFLAACQISIICRLLKGCIVFHYMHILCCV